jgi:hypothetical protein
MLLLGCDSPNNNSMTNNNSEEARLFKFSVLDDVGDTIAKDFSVQIKMPMDTMFMGPLPHVINYAQFATMDSLILQEDMATIGQINAIHCAGRFVQLKRILALSEPGKCKVNYVQDIDWTKVNAHQVNCIFEIWGIYGEEYRQAVIQANSENKSLAEFHYQWTETNQRDPEFFKHALDSVFHKGYDPNQYYLTWGDAETEAFQIEDEGVIGDLNGDGIADRLLRYHKQGVAGVCGVTRKERGGRLEFFKIK